MINTRVLIEKERLASLLKDELKLRLLDNGGVDNWEWYGEAFYGDDVELDYEKECDAIDNRIATLEEEFSE